MAKGLPSCTKAWSKIKASWPLHLTEIAKKMREKAKVKFEYENDAEPDVKND